MKQNTNDLRQRRKLHIRRNLFGTQEKPRVFIFRSNQYMTISVADDDAKKVLVSFRAGKTIKECGELGEKMGKFLTGKGIKKACFDRSGYRFHTRLNALVEGIKKNGISI